MFLNSPTNELADFGASLAVAFDTEQRRKMLKTKENHKLFLSCEANYQVDRKINIFRNSKTGV